MKKRYLWIVLLGFLLGCSDESDEHLFNSFELIQSGPGYTPITQVESMVVGAIDWSQHSVEAAFEDLESQAVAEALIRAQNRGVKVRVVGDEDHQDQLGFTLLKDALGEQIQWGDGPLYYSPQPSAYVDRSGDMNRMTHNFLIVDDQLLINLSAGFVGQNGVLDQNLTQLGFLSYSEDLPRDFKDEFEQMFGGVFATTLDTYNGPVKSNANFRESYPSDGGDLEVYFGPQERIIKRVIDDIYQAKASIYIMTERLDNHFLANALVDKAATGFNLSVIIDQNSYDPNSEVLVQLKNGFAQAATVPGSVQNNHAELKLGHHIGQTLIIIDAETSPIDGKIYHTKAMVLTQPLVETVPYVEYRGGLIGLTSDAFMDSNMWILNQYIHKTNPLVIDLTRDFISLFEQADPLP